MADTLEQRAYFAVQKTNRQATWHGLCFQTLERIADPQGNARGNMRDNAARFLFVISRMPNTVY